MSVAVSDTSPLLYLHRIGAAEWLTKLFNEVWTPGAVLQELQEGRRKGHVVPAASDYPWLRVVEPRTLPSDGRRWG